MLLVELREQVIAVAMEAHRRGVVYGTAGNFSIRDEATDLVAITPTGMTYGQMTPADVVIVTLDGEVQDGCRKPSSETPMHTMIMRHRPDIRAIVHTHSHFCTVVSTFKPCLPPILTETALVVDAGHTEFHGVPTKTTVAIGPARAEDIDVVTGPEGLIPTKLA